MIVLSLTTLASGGTMSVQTEVDPVTRYVRVIYSVPAAVPDSIRVRASFSTDNGKTFSPAAVRKYRSMTAEQTLMNDPIMARELASGEVTELIAGGRQRTLVWQTYPQIPLDKKQTVVIRVEIFDESGTVLAQGQASHIVDLTDVVLLNGEDVLQKNLLRKTWGEGPGWVWRTDLKEFPNGLIDSFETSSLLEPITFMPELRGYYAVFVKVPQTPGTNIEMRLLSDLYSQRFGGFDGREHFWRIAKMDHESIVLGQPWRVIEPPAQPNDDFRARMEYIKLVPLTPELYESVTRIEHMKHDKLVYAYLEPYSWACIEYVDRSSKLIEALAPYADARVDSVDIQMGRIGSKPNYPSLIEKPLVEPSLVDPPELGMPAPINTNVGRLTQFANSMTTFNALGKAVGVQVRANQGAGIAYHDTPSEGEISIQHPEWMLSSEWPLYRYEEVRQYGLDLYKELLDMGARHLSIDFCRYPFGIDSPDQPTIFLRDLRNLADQYAKDGQRVTILVRFPVPGMLHVNDNFKPETWIKEKLVDVIVPANIYANMLFFDVSPYVRMTRDTGVKCLPCIDFVAGMILPGQAIRRAKQIYDAGADGIYFYQADMCIVGVVTSMLHYENRGIVAKMGSQAAVDAMVEEMDRKDDDFSTELYLQLTEPGDSSRLRAWVEGGQVEEIHATLNGKEIPVLTEVPYTIGAEGVEGNYPAGPAVFEVRAKVHGKWLTRTHQATIVDAVWQ
jgi:hypothetical protein